jgi:hypothetical protein
MIGPRGMFGAVSDLSSFADGTITVTVTLTSGAKVTTLSATMGKNSVAPLAPTVSAAAFSNIATSPAYNVTVTGQVGAIANVVVGDGATPVVDYSNGMDFVASNGTVVIPVYLVSLLDGPLTISVTLTNGAGDSSATTLVVTKDTVAPALSVSAPPYINSLNVSSYQAVATGEVGATANYSITDGTTTLTGTRSAIPSSGKWNANINATKLKDGPVTLTITETDPAGNNTVSVVNLVKVTVLPAAPTVALNALDDSGASSTDYMTNVTAPRFTVTAPAGTTTAVYVGGVLYTGQKLADGSYTVTATATDIYGNVSAAGTAPKQLVVDTSAPTGTVTVAGAKTFNGQLATNTPTPTLQLSFADRSGVSQMAFSIDGGNTWTAWQVYGTSATITLPAADGIYTVVVKLLDVAGNTGTYSQTLRLDRTGPAITSTMTAPTNSGSYDLGTNPTFTYGATDVDSVSTIGATLDSSTTNISSGSSINLYTLGAGTHTLTIKATDGLGNVSTTTVTFQIHSTISGLINAVNYGGTSGYINSSTQSTLLSILNSAKAAQTAGNTASAKSYVNQFITQVQSAGSVKIAASYAALLVSWGQDLYARM